MSDTRSDRVVPVTPQNVVDARRRNLPNEVISIFNEEISSRWDGTRSVVPQVEVIRKIMAALNIDRQEIFNRHYLDVELVFAGYGWHVLHEKAELNDVTDSARYIFAPIGPISVMPVK